MKWQPLYLELQDAIEQAVHWARWHGHNALVETFQKWLNEGGYWYPTA